MNCKSKTFKDLAIPTKSRFHIFMYIFRAPISRLVLIPSAGCRKELLFRKDAIAAVFLPHPVLQGVQFLLAGEGEFCLRLRKERTRRERVFHPGNRSCKWVL